MSLSCPSCEEEIPNLVEVCPSCGLNYNKLLTTLGQAPPFTGRILDPQNRLEKESATLIRNTISAFEANNRRYSFHFAILDIPETWPLSVIGFWLANQIGPQRPANKIGHTLEALLIIAPNLEEARWTLGYGLEPWISPTALKQSLLAGQHDFQQHNWATGACNCLNHLVAEMEKISLEFDSYSSAIKGADY